MPVGLSWVDLIFQTGDLLISSKKRRKDCKIAQNMSLGQGLNIED
jgi:hypothetical protein